MDSAWLKSIGSADTDLPCTPLESPLIFIRIGYKFNTPKTTVGVIHSSLGLHKVFIEFMHSTFLRYVISKYVKKMHTIFFITPCISPRHQYHYLLSALLLIFVYRADTGYTLEKSNLL